jgi:hypothetical protein
MTVGEAMNTSLSDIVLTLNTGGNCLVRRRRTIRESEARVVEKFASLLFGVGSHREVKPVLS